MRLKYDIFMDYFFLYISLCPSHLTQRFVVAAALNYSFVIFGMQTLVYIKIHIFRFNLFILPFSLFSDKKLEKCVFFAFFFTSFFLLTLNKSLIHHVCGKKCRIDGKKPSNSQHENRYGFVPKEKKRETWKDMLENIKFRSISATGTQA